MPNLDSSADLDDNQVEFNDEAREDISEEIEWENHYEARTKRWRTDKKEMLKDEISSPENNLC